MDYRLHLRYAPLPMLILEGLLGKLVFLGLVAVVVVRATSRTSMEARLDDIYASEVLLIFQSILELLRELGFIIQYNFK